MDLLKQLTQEKKEALQTAKQRRQPSHEQQGKQKTYLRRADIDQAEQEYQQSKKRQKVEHSSSHSHDKGEEEQDRVEEEHRQNRQQKHKDNHDMKQQDVDKQPEEELERIYPQEEVTKALRKYGQVVRYFGETNRERVERMLRFEAEIGDELAIGEEYGDFAKTKQEMKDTGGLHVNKSIADPHQQTSADHSTRKKKKEEEEGDASEEDSDQEGDQGYAKHRRYHIENAMDLHKYRFNTNEKMSDWKFVYRFFRQLLKEWEAELSKRDAEYASTAHGRQEVRYYKQNKDSLRPFFRACKKKDLPEAVLEHVMRMCEFCLQREYRLAVDQYIQLAIGNSPWPIGVTGTGLHERAARTRIHTNNIAHILNDERKRKYIHAIKNMISKCQDHYPTDPSRMFKA